MGDLIEVNFRKRICPYSLLQGELRYCVIGTGCGKSILDMELPLRPDVERLCLTPNYQSKCGRFAQASRLERTS